MDTSTLERLQGKVKEVMNQLAEGTFEGEDEFITAILALDGLVHSPNPSISEDHKVKALLEMKILIDKATHPIEAHIRDNIRELDEAVGNMDNFTYKIKEAEVASENWDELLEYVPSIDEIMNHTFESLRMEKVDEVTIDKNESFGTESSNQREIVLRVKY